MSYSKEQFEHLVHDLEISITNDGSLYKSFLEALKPMYLTWQVMNSPNDFETEKSKKERYKERLLQVGFSSVMPWVRMAKNKYEKDFDDVGKFPFSVVVTVTKNIVEHWLIEFTLGNHPF